jgi:hypothetical protein
MDWNVKDVPVEVFHRKSYTESLKAGLVSTGVP